MSVSKIKRELELLEKQLEEIEINVTDPIERIEQKKQLEKKIRKLKQSKIQREQLEKEQQELESLKSEFSPNNFSSNNNELVDQRQFEVDEQIEQISPITDNSIDAEFLPNFERQLNESSSTQAKSKESESTTSTSIVGIKIKHILILGLILGCVVTAGAIINYNSAQKAEAIRLKELARRETIEAKAEAEKAKQERRKAIEAIEAAEKAKQQAIQARKEAVNLIKNNSYTSSIKTSSPESFIREHYMALNSRNYNLTWQSLTPEFQSKSGSFYDYTDWWNSVRNIEIGRIQIVEQNNNRAVVDAQLKYFMNTGTTYKYPKSRIYLIWDDYSSRWLFENKQ